MILLCSMFIPVYNDTICVEIDQEFMLKMKCQFFYGQQCVYIYIYIYLVLYIYILSQLNCVVI